MIILGRQKIILYPFGDFMRLHPDPTLAGAQRLFLPLSSTSGRIRGPYEMPGILNSGGSCARQALLAAKLSLWLSQRIHILILFSKFIPPKVGLIKVRYNSETLYSH